MSEDLTTGAGFDRDSAEAHCDPEARLCFKTIVSHLLSSERISGILWGGSQWREGGDQYSDCDLFCLVHSNSDREIEELTQELRIVPCVRLLLQQGSFPWFGVLVTILFEQHPYFSIDIGFVSLDKGEDFFWEPTGQIIKDETGIIRKATDELIKKNVLNPYGPTTPWVNLLLLLHKLRKNVARGHYWNAHEYVTQMRRYLMYMLRKVHVQGDSYLGRPDRNIEDVLSAAESSRLADTFNNLTESVLLRSAYTIVEWCLELSAVQAFDLDGPIEAEICNVMTWLHDKLRESEPGQ